MHGLIFETSICYWQDQPGSPRAPGRRGRPPDLCAGVCGAPPSAQAARTWERRRGEARQRGVWVGRPRPAHRLGVLRNIVLAGGPPRRDGEVPRVRVPGDRRPAAGSVVGRLGQTVRLGLATDRSAWEERRGEALGPPRRTALPAAEANPHGRRNQPPERRR